MSFSKPRPSDFVGIILSDGPDSMPDQTNKIVLPRRGPTVVVSFDEDQISAVTINGHPVIVSTDVEKGEIVVKRGGTSDAYILTDSNRHGEARAETSRSSASLTTSNQRHLAHSTNL
jgi:hypothetical protein